MTATRASGGPSMAGDCGDSSLCAVARQLLARQPLARRLLPSHRTFPMAATALASSPSGKGRAWCEARAGLQRCGTRNWGEKCLTESLGGFRPSAAAGHTKSQGHTCTKPLLFGLTAFIFWAIACPSYLRKGKDNRMLLYF